MSVLANLGNELFVSSVSAWEIAVKHSLDKLPLPKPPDEFVRQVMRDLIARPLPFAQEHALAARHLPWHHRDPFDRMLLCQAKVEGLTLVTADEAIRQYGVPTLW